MASLAFFNANHSEPTLPENELLRRPQITLLHSPPVADIAGLPAGAPPALSRHPRGIPLARLLAPSARHADPNPDSAVLRGSIFFAAGLGGAEGVDSGTAALVLRPTGLPRPPDFLRDVAVCVSTDFDGGLAGILYAGDRGSAARCDGFAGHREKAALAHFGLDSVGSHPGSVVLFAVLGAVGLEVGCFDSRPPSHASA